MKKSWTQSLLLLFRAAMIFGVGWLFALPVARAGELRPVANLFKSPSAPAELGFEASLLALIICAAIFIVVAGLLI